MVRPDARNADDLATLITWEDGKPLAEAKGEVGFAANFFEWFSEEAPRIYGDNIPASVPGNRIVTIKEPVGMVGILTPWNFPAGMITRKVAPALAAGCTVVCKAPGETPLTGLALAELAERAGITKGVVNIITTIDNTPAIGKAMCTNTTVAKVSFTGSTAVGQLLMQQASLELKVLSVELGGNASFIVFDDANLDLAVAGAVACKFRSSGQTCVCANRLYVQDTIVDEFTRRFVAEVKKFKQGNGFDADVTHGPLIHERAVRKVNAHVRDAEANGAKVVLGGQPVPSLGLNYYQPTVITGVTSDMAIATEETFGPVAGIFTSRRKMRLWPLQTKRNTAWPATFFRRTSNVSAVSPKPLRLALWASTQVLSRMPRHRSVVSSTLALVVRDPSMVLRSIFTSRPSPTAEWRILCRSSRSNR